MFDINPFTSTTYKDGLVDNEYTDSLTTLCLTAFEQLPTQEEKAAVARWLFELSNCPADDDFYWSLVNRTIYSQIEPKLLAKTVFDFVLEKPDQYYFPKNSQIVNPFDELLEDRSFLYFYTSLLPKEAVIYLSEQEDKYIKAVLGGLIYAEPFSNLIEEIRNQIKNPENPPEVTVRLERMGKILLGLAPDDSRPFHTSLESFYKSFCIGEYHTNEVVNQEEVAMVAGLVKETGLEEGSIVDNACGMGRIANTLAKNGYSDIVGVDISPRNLHTAKEHDETGSIEYRQADWADTGLRPESARAFLLVGRSGHHARNSYEFQQISKEAYEVLKPGGIFVFDFADPDKGMYLENRRNFLRILASLNFPLEKLGTTPEEQLKEIDNVVDSPDGINFTNRWVPQIKDILLELKIAGFEDVQIIRKPIEGWKGAENLYFIAKKPL